MIVFPNAKINLGLQVTEKRPDGYHNIASVFYPLGLTDILEALPAEAFSFTASGLPIDATPDKNLCCKAWELLKKDFSLPPVAMYLHKIIPMGAGLGGGSSDGAYTLILLNQLFRLNLGEQQLVNYALQLGSDCPFFIINQPVIAKGRGEIMEKIDLPQLKGKKVLLVNPGLHINTGWAFSQIKPRENPESLAALCQLPLAAWKGKIQNDFEPGVFHHYPQLQQIKEQLYKCGAVYASMTGTGSTIYGIFDQLPDNYSAFFEPGYKLIVA
ncbi:4-(cytidine 5'-diphospho)-2-C-methyl-D-erythritol kinase [Flavihumibacter profundi]|uniref:4-(cytidine 5'-diphospho)-2-C-methyl-D-erythritol kinase n=1 Tax=Flavihumibacter profundi TaxID=2716883 RepID=UPI001CC68031|nr:4-(cytidine 5'-diphospho)-2-C-methyl-D-erythritol kinase [Flavihumibacter profundi]MBZ5856446.1 4-(cytidine 5'-diphospho)-2-C-methyl-D-erythritol kinase [Flavihumibacter profundi]